MQKLPITNPSRCLSMPYKHPLLSITVVITIAIFSYPWILFLTTNSHCSLPLSLHRQISHLQTQVGSLLEQLHAETNDPNGHSSSQYANQLLPIAVSLDHLVTQLSNLYVKGSSTQCSGTEEQEEDDTEADGVLLAEKLFNSQEAQSYTSPKPNAHGAKSFLGVDFIYPSLGLTCESMPTGLDRFMSYKINQLCPDDWLFAQKLILAGCDPLPRRRCFSRSPPHYTKPLPISSSLWNLPSDNNILWTHYKCKGFSCLMPNGTVTDKGFFKCSDCFNLSRRGWEMMMPSNETETISAEFTIDEVLRLKPGEIRIGLDFSPTTGTFAAIMKERNVTIAAATLNLGAPFNEAIALRGILPLYISIGSRLPFFDNTLDMIHSTLFLDGWIRVEFLQYVLIDWDRVLRPKGLLWVDRFFCHKEVIKEYLDEFGRLGYKKLMWRVVPKMDRKGDEVFFSAVLEKPLRTA